MTSEPSEKAESLTKKLGVTYRPKTNTDRMDDQFKKDLGSAERMGLLFLPPRGNFGYSTKELKK